VSKKINRLVNNFWDKIVDDLSLEEKGKIVKFSVPPEKCKIFLCIVINPVLKNPLKK
jgi:hypothetical protein